MKITASVKLNLKTKEARIKVEGATRLGLRDTIVAIAGDAIRMSPKKTGHNSRSIAAEVSGMGVVENGGEGSAERMVDDDKLEAATYSTSGYGGYLETGTRRSRAFSYFKPALDMHIKELIPNIKKRLESAK